MASTPSGIRGTSDNIPEDQEIHPVTPGATRAGVSGTLKSREGKAMTTAEFSANVLSDIDHRRQLRRAVIASTIGTTIEWYDFLLYSIVTGLVFAKLYFPASDPLIGTMQAYAVLRQNANRFQGEMK